MVSTFFNRSSPIERQAVRAPREGGVVWSNVGGASNGWNITGYSSRSSCPWQQEHHITINTSLPLTVLTDAMTISFNEGLKFCNVAKHDTRMDTRL